MVIYVMYNGNWFPGYCFSIFLPNYGAKMQFFKVRGVLVPVVKLQIRTKS
jgi:hypothetical protein